MRQGGRDIEALGLVAGFVLWSLVFVLLYGAHGLACASGVRPGQGDGVTRLALVVILALGLTAHVWLVFSLRRRLAAARSRAVRFVRMASLALAVAAAVATLWTGWPVVALSICR